MTSQTIPRLRFRGEEMQAWSVESLAQIGPDRETDAAPLRREVPEYTNEEAVFVCTDGDDTNDGTRDARIQHLRPAALKARAAGHNRVVITDSAKYIDKALDFNNIEILAASGETPTLTLTLPGRENEHLFYQPQTANFPANIQVNQCAVWVQGGVTQIYAATSAGLYRSTNGTEWTLAHFGQNEITGCCVYQNALVFANNTDRKIYRSTAHSITSATALTEAFVLPREIQDAEWGRNNANSFIRGLLGGFTDRREVKVGKCFAAGRWLCVNMENIYVHTTWEVAHDIEDYIRTDGGYYNATYLWDGVRGGLNISLWNDGEPHCSLYGVFINWRNATPIMGEYIKSSPYHCADMILDEASGNIYFARETGVLRFRNEGEVAFSAVANFSANAAVRFVRRDNTIYAVSTNGVDALSGNAWVRISGSALWQNTQIHSAYVDIDNTITIITNTKQQYTYRNTILDTGHTLLNIPIAHFIIGANEFILSNSGVLARWDRRLFPPELPASIEGCILDGENTVSNAAPNNVSFLFSIARNYNNQAITNTMPVVYTNSRFEDIRECLFSCGENLKTNIQFCEFVAAPLRIGQNTEIKDCTSTRGQIGVIITHQAVNIRRCIFAENGIDIHVPTNTTENIVLFSCFFDSVRGFSERIRTDRDTESPFAHLLRAHYTGSPLFANSTARDFRLKSFAFGYPINSGLIVNVGCALHTDMRELIGARQYSRRLLINETIYAVDCFLSINPSHIETSVQPMNFAKTFSQTGGMFTSETNPHNYKTTYKLTWDKVGADASTVQKQIENLMRIYGSPSVLDFGESYTGEDWLPGYPVRVRVDKSRPFMPGRQMPYRPNVIPDIPTNYEITLCETDNYALTAEGEQ